MTDTLLSLGKSISYCNVVSSCGHDAFLLQDDLPIYGELTRAFLDNIQNGVPVCVEEDDFYVHAPTSIFGAIHRPRLDNEQIVKLVHPDASVLDLGCGTGLGSPFYRPYAKLLIGVDVSADHVQEVNLAMAHQPAADLQAFLSGKPLVQLFISNQADAYVGDGNVVL